MTREIHNTIDIALDALTVYTAKNGFRVLAGDVMQHYGDRGWADSFPINTELDGQQAEQVVRLGAGYRIVRNGSVVYDCSTANA